MNDLLQDKTLALAGHLLGKEVQTTFLTRADVLALHEQVIGAFGGGTGIRDLTLLESALGRPMQAVCYDETMDAIDASAMLGEAIIRNHAFIDGNKRSGFFAMVVMLDENGYDFNAEAADIVYMIKELAASTIDSEQFATWVRQNCVQREADRNTESNNITRPRPAG